MNCISGEFLKSLLCLNHCIGGLLFSHWPIVSAIGAAQNDRGILSHDLGKRIPTIQSAALDFHAAFFLLRRYRRGFLPAVTSVLLASHICTAFQSNSSTAGV